MATYQSPAGRIEYLYRKHVGTGQVSVPRLEAVVSRELRIVSSGARGTSGLLRELRSERYEIGRLVKVLLREALR